jgi:hypothetical protein
MLSIRLLDTKLSGGSIRSRTRQPLRRARHRLERRSADVRTGASWHGYVDLIMMPTHGVGTFRSFLVGSVTAKVLHDATRLSTGLRSSRKRQARG